MLGAENMGATEAQKRAVAKYDKGKDLIKFRVPKGKKEEYQKLAERSGMSLTAYITSVLEEKLKEEH